MEVHHIYGRFGGDRAHDHRNLLLCCRDCHTAFHAGGVKSLTLGQMLTAKEQEDGVVDVEFLASLKGRKGLLASCERLPQWVQLERKERAQDGV
jgi:hypothetical protein